jgi:hypothetical protein
LAVTGLLLLLTRTLFTDGARMVADFHNDAWYIQQQAHWLETEHAPSLFTTGDVTAFYPLFAFYGGTLFVVTGVIALLSGSAMFAQAAVYMLALAGAYGGWLWLARMAGLRSWPAHAAAILYVTAPHILTNVYARQDFAESVATAAIPPLLASTISILRADRLRAGPAAALAASAIAFSGSHNLTLLWGTTVLTVAALAVLACVPQARALITRQGVLRLLAVAIPAVAVNAWYLIPDLAYHSDTFINARVEEWIALLRAPNPVMTAGHLLSPGRPGASTGASYTLPTLAATWAIATVLLARRRRRPGWGRLFLVVAALTVVLVLVMTHARVLLVLPDQWLMLQGSLRLGVFALLGVCGSVLAAQALAARQPQWLTGLLLVILLFSCGAAVYQVRHAPLDGEEHPTNLAGEAPFGIGDFADANVKVLPSTSSAPLASFKFDDVHDGRFDVVLPAGPGDVIRTTLMAPAEMLHIEGAHVAGRWAATSLRPDWQPRWYLALRIDDDAAPGQARITVSEGRSLPIVAGKAISLLGLLGLVAVAITIAIRRPAPLLARGRPRRPRS